MSQIDEIFSLTATPALLKFQGQTVTHVDTAGITTEVQGVFTQHDTRHEDGQASTRLKQTASLLVSSTDLAIVNTKHCFFIAGKTWAIKEVTPSGNNWLIELTRQPTTQTGRDGLRGKR